MSATGGSSSTRVCCFCNLADVNDMEYGKIYEHGGIVTHYYCLLLSSNMEQKGNDDDGILGFLVEDIQKELRRGKRLVCSHCRKNGATLGCCNVKCKRIFHLPCGLKAGSLHQFFGEFRSYCINHRPKQKIDNYVLKQISSSDDVLCYICYDKVNPNDFVNTLWAPCCKKNAWFHRKCVQQLALSAGYFFKCPLCNNKKDYQKAMQEYGIFIPSQDASWELVPNAFEELLYRHDQCDATICLCPKGRKHTSSNAKWELTLCRTCGSQGIHMACGQLKWANPVWECAECISILCSSKDNENISSANSSDSSSQFRDSDSDDSDTDTDISVGTDYPIPRLLPTPTPSSISVESGIKLRPGPRSFKLQQQMKADRMAKCTLECTHAVSEIKNITSPKGTAELSLRNNIVRKELFKDKENNSQQENKEDNSQQTGKKNDSEEGRKSSSNGERSISIPNKEDVIIIESDDDIEIVSLKEMDSSKVQTVKPNILHSSERAVSSTNTTECAAISKDTSALITSLKTNNTNRQESRVSKSKVLNKDESIVTEQSSTAVPQDFKQDPSPSNLEGTNMMDTSLSSVMNIKITNVTSLSPEVFASVPDVKHEKNVVWFPTESVDTPPLHSSRLVANKPLEKWFVMPQSNPYTKRGMHEDVNGIADNKCKRIKGDSFNETSTNTVDIIAYDTSQKQNRGISETESDMVREDIKDFLKCTTSANGTSNLMLNNSEENDLLTQLVRKVDAKYENVKMNQSEGEDASKIVLQNKETSVEMPYSAIARIIPNNQLYIQTTKLSNVIYSNQILNANPSLLTSNQDAQNAKNTTYTIPTNVILSQMMNNTGMINNHQTMVVNQPVVANITEPNNTSNNQTVGLNKQEVSLAKEKLSDNVSKPGNSSSNRIVCDGDAGRTSPAVTARPACCSENAKTAESPGISETVKIDSNNQRADSPSRSRATAKRSSKRKVRIENSSTESRSVFPQITNNHNACHQPRLIPQYMQLHDLKFRVCGSDSVQMILYDTFSVNIPVENFSKRDKIRSAVAARESRESTVVSRARGETSSSLEYVDGTATAIHLGNDRTKRIADATVVAAVRDHDDAKENLDPISRTLSRNAVPDNISVMNSVDNTVVNEYVCGGDDSPRIRLVPSDINLSRTICNTNVDNNIEECVGLIPNDRNQATRVNTDDMQHKQSVCDMEERFGARLFRNRTVRSIDFDLNVVNKNKDITKVLRDDITVSTNQHDIREIGGGNTDDSPMLCLNNPACALTNARGAKNNYKCLDGTSVTRPKTRDRSVALMSTITFNERSILNRELGAYDLRAFIPRCTAFHENIINHKTENTSKYNIKSCLKVSIDLCRIQNLMDSKPELFANLKHVDDDQRYKCASPLCDEDGYTRIKYYAVEDGIKRSPSRNNKSQIQARDIFSSANTFERCRKQKCETTYSDMRNLDR